MDDNNITPQGKLRGTLAHGLNSVATLIITVVMLRSDIIGLENDELHNAYDRIAHLETLHQDTRELILRQSTEIATMRMQLDVKFNPELYITQFIQALKKPAWIKVWDGEHFRMLMINEKYERVYGISRAKYEGRTDYDIYDKEVADVFARGDKETLDSRDFRESVEMVVPVGTGPVRVRVWKFYMRLPDGREAVGGIIID